MVGLDRASRRLFFLLTAVGSVILLFNLTLITGTDVRATVQNIPIHIPLTEDKPASDIPIIPPPPSEVSSNP